MNTFTEKHVAYIIERLLGYIPSYYDFNQQHLDPISEIYTEDILSSAMKDLIKTINEPTYTFDDFHYSLRDPDTLQLILHLVYDFDIDEQQFKKYFEKTTGLEVYSIELLDTNEVVIEFISPKITKLSDKCYNKLLNELNVHKLPNNVYVTKWVNQNDLLGDDRVKCFITHGGINSVAEAVYHNKPMIVLGVGLDQINTAAFVKKKRIGVTVQNKNEMNSNFLINAINDVLAELMVKDENGVTAIEKMVMKHMGMES